MQIPGTRYFNGLVRIEITLKLNLNQYPELSMIPEIIILFSPLVRAFTTLLAESEMIWNEEDCALVCQGVNSRNELLNATVHAIDCRKFETTDSVIGDLQFFPLSNYSKNH